jgi:predicted O-methyltransferase YrrM
MSVDVSSPPYQFSNLWFNDAVKGIWRELLLQLEPSRVLEIGSFEGASASFVIQQVGTQRALELHCVDTWQGGEEHQPGSAAAADMKQVEGRFRSNVNMAMASVRFPVRLEVHRARSDAALPKLLCDKGPGYFDMVYVDGSHQAADVLWDALLAFKLLRVGGLMVLDDYLWPGHSRHDVLMAPKIAIDAFTTVHASKVRILSAPLYQLYVVKTDN